MKTRYIITAIALLSAVSTINAQSVNEIARKAASLNREVAVTALPGRAEVEQMLAENRLPDPTIELEQLWGNKADAGNKFTVGISQEVEWPGVYASRANAANAASDALPSLVEATFLEKAMEAKLIILEIIYQRNVEATYSKIYNRMDSIAALSSRARSGGEMTVLDRNKIEIERITLENEISTTHQDIEDLISQLSVLAGDNDISAMLSGITDYPTEQLLSMDEYMKMYETSDPTILYNNAMLRSNVAQRDVIKKEGLPSLSLGYTFNHENGISFNGLNASVSLPLYSRKHSSALLDIKESEYLTTMEGATAAYKTETESLRKKCTQLNSRIENLKKALTASDPFLILQKAYKGGQITLLEYIQEINFYTETDLMLHKAEYDYAVTLAKLNKLDLLKK